MSALTNWRLKTKRLYIKKRVFITLQTMASPSPFWGCGVVLLQFSLSAVDASNLLDYDRMVIGLSILFGSNPLHHSSKSHPTHPHDSFYGSESATWSVQTSHTELKDRFLFFYFLKTLKDRFPGLLCRQYNQLAISTGRCSSWPLPLWCHPTSP